MSPPRNPTQIIARLMKCPPPPNPSQIPLKSKPHNNNNISPPRNPVQISIARRLVNAPPSKSHSNSTQTQTS